MNDVLELLQAWYKSNCDSQWEHQYGVSIETLDNPGWKLVIDLEETVLESAAFEDLKIDRTEHDWISCRVAKTKFHGYGGPRNLREILQVFLNWNADVERLQSN